MNCWSCNRVVDVGDRYCLDGSCRGIDGAPTPLQVGELRIVGELGEGQYGRVYRCHDGTLGRDVAVKVLLRTKAAAAAALKREAQMISRVDHPNVVKVYDVVESPLSIVMQLVPGGSLAAYAVARRAEGKPLTESEVIRLVSGVARGIAAAHRAGICHRDIKAENVVLGTDLEPVVTDFGVARIVSTVDGAGSFVGTPSYMAPEIFSVSSKYDERVDVWSLGVLAYWLLLGRYPFPDVSLLGMAAQLTQAPTRYLAPRTVEPKISLEFDALIREMIAPLSSRVGSAEIVLTRLERIAAPNRQFQTLDELERLIVSIYASRNSRKSPGEIAAFYLVKLTELIDLLVSVERPGSAALDGAVVASHAAKAFAWLCALVARCGWTVCSVIDHKYSAGCPYCELAECGCGGAVTAERRRMQNERMLRIETSGHGLCTLEGSRALIQRTYGTRNRLESRASLCLRALLEVAQYISTQFEVHVESGGNRHAIHRLELADVAAWYFAVVDSINPAIDVRDACSRLFAGGACYVCHSPYCVCPEVDSRIRASGWRGTATEGAV